jgi:large subunit ribosomal protein L13
MIIDGNNKIVGRVATFAAKKALLGEKVDIINCEKMLITGKKGFLISDAKRKYDRGTFKGPLISRMPDRYVRRIIRGMLPYKQDKGSKAYKNVMCHIGIPKGFEGKDKIDIKEADVSKIKNINYMKLGELCKKLGAKYE